MKALRSGLVVVVAALALVSTGAVWADGAELDPLLELLVKRGLITQEEGEAVQAEYDRRDGAAAPGGDAESAATRQVVVAEAQAPAPELPKALKGLKICTTTYISYQRGSEYDGVPGETSDYSKATIKRGYLDIRKKVTPWLSFRMTPDVHQDETGDFKVRFKYLHAKFTWEDMGFLTQPHAELGIAHMPWLDFEEHVNRFRMQDTMFLERNGLFNSADVGLLIGSNFGGELSEEYQNTVADHYAGRWGSFQVGVYNGGGYHASEKNDDMVVEGRLTVRPLPDVVPGLQLSFLGIDGRGNVADTPLTDPPKWEVFNAMLSYESPRFVATAQIYDGKGNQKGTAVNPDGTARPQDGYSLFTEVRFTRDRKWSLFGRYDHFDIDSDDPKSDERDRTILGLAWQFLKGSYWVLDLDRLEHADPSIPTEDRIQLTLQVHY